MLYPDYLHSLHYHLGDRRLTLGSSQKQLHRFHSVVARNALGGYTGKYDHCHIIIATLITCVHSAT